MQELTADRLRQLLRYDSDTGVFFWKMPTSFRVQVGDIAGSYDRHRVSIRLAGVSYQAHILAWLYVFDELPPSTLTHKNGDPHDNRICNLVPVKSGKPLTADRLRELLHYDPETGVFTRRVTCGARSIAGQIAGSKNKRQGHWFISVDSQRHQAHRLAWLYVHGHWPEQNIDHINGDGFDNRIENLRDVSQAVNMQNQRNGRSGTSQYLGVCWDSTKNQWLAQIKRDRKNMYLGHFDEEEQAHAQYLVAKRRLHAGCTI